MIPKSVGYTLWLVPKAKTYERFEKLIKKLAKEYNAPVFEPHITLLGDIKRTEEEMVKKTAQLVKGQKQFPVTLRHVDYQDFYFRTLFVKAEITKHLQALHKRAKEIFQMDIPPYMPHLSLLYGNYPVDLKKKIISDIGREQPAQFEVTGVFLKQAGEIKDWKIIKEFPF